MNNLLEFKNVSKAYGTHTALSHISFGIEPGKITGLLGPNGSGKSTIIKLINGLLLPSDGEILINGINPSIDTKKQISYLPERSYLDNSMNVKNVIDFFNDFYEDFNLNKALEMLQRLNINPSSKLKTLSKGTKEKVQLILVMSRDAKLYCLDEPIAGVDPAARDYILNTIISNYSEDASILISTHLITDIENILDDVIFLNNGEIKLHSSVEDIRFNQNKSVDTLFREVFRC